MRRSISGGLALALLLAGGLAACNETDNAAVPPADEPAQTGSVPADPAAPPLEDPAMEPAPATPPAEGGAVQ
jgi:hypothetical protein